MVMFGVDAITFVTAAAKRSRSTANASPAGTRASSPQRITIESISRISCLSRPTALVGAEERKEFEHTSSARFDVACAGVDFTGRISWRSTLCPRLASANAHSLPASPAPMILIFMGFVSESRLLWSGGLQPTGHSPGVSPAPRWAEAHRSTYGFSYWARSA
jgi:hypothetical protein